MKTIILPTSPSKTQFYINQAYAEYLLKGGFNPLLVIPGHNLDMALKLAHGVLLPGGIDVDPIYYGEDNYSCQATDVAKDEFERELFHKAMDRKLPVFGICRGFQLIIQEYMLACSAATNVMYFNQHISSHNQVNEQGISRTNQQHFVEFKPDILYGAEETGVVKMPVNSMHHQCLMLISTEEDEIAQYAPHFKLAAATTRGISGKNTERYAVCEGYALDWDTKILAVQWHPEELMDVALIQNFFGQTKKTKNKGAFAAKG